MNSGARANTQKSTLYSSRGKLPGILVSAVLLTVLSVPPATGAADAGSEGQQSASGTAVKLLIDRAVEPTGSIGSGRSARQYTMTRRQASDFEAGVTCDDGEWRCFLVEQKDMLHSIVARAEGSRHAKNPLLLEWNVLRLLPPSYYHIVFIRSSGSVAYAAIPEDALPIDGYPSVPANGHALRSAGFNDIKQLRLVLYPPAWRFFELGLHEPLLAPGAWPTSTMVKQSGYELTSSPRDALQSKLTVACPVVGAAESWCPALWDALRTRHWPVKDVVQEVSHQCSSFAESGGGLDAFLASSDFPKHGMDPAGLIKLLRHIATHLDELPRDVAAGYRTEIRASRPMSAEQCPAAAPSNPDAWLCDLERVCHVDDSCCRHVHETIVQDLLGSVLAPRLEMGWSKSWEEQAAAFGARIMEGKSMPPEEVAAMRNWLAIIITKLWMLDGGTHCGKMPKYNSLLSKSDGDDDDGGDVPGEPIPDPAQDWFYSKYRDAVYREEA